VSDNIKYEIAKINLDNIVRKSANIPSHIPKEVALLPTPEEERDILKMIKFNGIWLILTYGAAVMDWIWKPGGWVLGQLIKLKFPTWEQKNL